MSTKLEYRKREADRRKAFSAKTTLTSSRDARNRIAATVLIISMLLVSIAGALGLAS